MKETIHSSAASRSKKHIGPLLFVSGIHQLLIQSQADHLCLSPLQRWLRRLVSASLLPWCRRNLGASSDERQIHGRPQCSDLSAAGRSDCGNRCELRIRKPLPQWSIKEKKIQRKVMLDINWKKLGVPSGSVLKDLRSGKHLSPGSCTGLEIPGYNFALIQIGE